MRSQMSAVPDNYRHYLRLKKDSKTIEDAAISSSLARVYLRLAIVRGLWARS
jgi:hypothetical protein